MPKIIPKMHKIICTNMSWKQAILWKVRHHCSFCRQEECIPECVECQEWSRRASPCIFCLLRLMKHCQYYTLVRQTSFNTKTFNGTSRRCVTGETQLCFTHVSRSIVMPFQGDSIIQALNPGWSSPSSLLHHIFYISLQTSITQ